MTPEALCEVLAAGRFDLSDEKACQLEIAAWFDDHCPDLVVSREHRLSHRDIVDFLAGSVAIEIKMNGAAPRPILRQLERYAAFPDVSAVILVSNRAIAAPATVCGKPLYVVSLGKAWL